MKIFWKELSKTSFSLFFFLCNIRFLFFFFCSDGDDENGDDSGGVVQS